MTATTASKVASTSPVPPTPQQKQRRADAAAKKRRVTTAPTTFLVAVALAAAVLWMGCCSSASGRRRSTVTAVSAFQQRGLFVPRQHGRRYLSSAYSRARHQGAGGGDFSAFSFFFAPTTATNTRRTTARRGRSDVPAVKGLFLSDIPQDQDKQEKRGSDGNKRNRNDRGGGSSDNDVDDDWLADTFVRFTTPPPFPEDQFVMTGDLLSLFVYAFTDHFVCRDLAQYLTAMTSDRQAAVWAIGDRAGSSALAGPDVAATATDHVLTSVPVWLDSTQIHHRDHVLHVLLDDRTITQYSPLLESAGMAACALAGAWLVSGWIHSAFQYKNTLECDTDRALAVTAQTWFTTTLLMLGGVAATNSIFLSSSSAAAANEFWWQTFSKGDVDYIFGALSVVCLWRFIASSMLGSGGGGGGRDD